MIGKPLRFSALLLASLLALDCGPAPESLPDSQGTVTAPIDPRRILRVAAADILGGGAGAAAGGTIGSLIPGVGTLAGAVVGGVICGASSSADAANKYATVAGVPAGSRAGDPSNSLNPYDDVGQRHNAALDYTASLTLGPYGCIPPTFPRRWFKDGMWEYANKKMGASPKFTNSPEFAAAWNDSLEFSSAGIEGDVERVIQQRVSQGKMTKNEGQWFTRLFKAIDPLDTADLIDATKFLERQVMADKALSDQERMNLLSAFSIARYSASYWSEQAARKDSLWRRCP